MTLTVIEGNPTIEAGIGLHFHLLLYMGLPYSAMKDGAVTPDDVVRFTQETWAEMPAGFRRNMMVEGPLVIDEVQEIPHNGPLLMSHCKVVAPCLRQRAYFRHRDILDQINELQKPVYGVAQWLWARDWVLSFETVLTVPVGKVVPPWLQTYCDYKNHVTRLVIEKPVTLPQQWNA